MKPWLFSEDYQFLKMFNPLEYCHYFLFILLVSFPVLSINIFFLNEKRALRGLRNPAMDSRLKTISLRAGIRVILILGIYTPRSFLPNCDPNSNRLLKLTLIIFINSANNQTPSLIYSIALWQDFPNWGPLIPTRRSALNFKKIIHVSKKITLK